MPRSSGVRASSHLEGRVAEPETARSAGGSPAPRSSAAGIDWMARLKELAEQQQQRRLADSAAPDSGPRRADEEHEPDEGKAHRDERDEGQEQPQGDPYIVEHDLSADSFASRTPVMVRSRLFEMRSAPNAFIKQKQQVRGNNQLTKSQSSKATNQLLPVTLARPSQQSSAGPDEATKAGSNANPDSQKEPTRKELILGSMPGNVKLKPNPAAKSDAPGHELTGVGIGAVAHYAEDIAYAARIKGIDPDLIRAIMYMEMSHGWYAPSGLGVPYSLLPPVKSILPMNVNANYWGDAFGTKPELSIGRTNVVSGAEMLRRLQKLSPGASIAEIATLYNNVNADKVSDYGARVAQIYKDKPWEILTKQAPQKESLK
ncbi:hypothetical protein [Prosthecobacter vanneervenii]|uniref:Transglycosylase SLT domain-containing protein n=1 Tax=Prosthecobacter vanneervenii TaxID=48466 RepID=A0A7W7YGE6_9BACT|nr:hypothetical protein [Prosthecobacter vanneervenii]MBB5035716.1 hypothetical protein [Prosthecobacter vanneervenii]